MASTLRLLLGLAVVVGTYLALVAVFPNARGSDWARLLAIGLGISVALAAKKS